MDIPQIINANDTQRFTRIGCGDDGIVYKYSSGSSSVAIKMYTSDIYTVEGSVESKFYREISEDQSNREIKALTLLKLHHNFMTLAHDKIEFVDYLSDGGQQTKRQIPCLFLKFVPDLHNVKHLSHFFGFKYRDGVNPFSPPQLKINSTMNFEHRNMIFKYMMHQIYDATIFMHSHGIKHRDLDTCNVKMEYPSFQIKIMDFARSDIPHVDGFPDSENPLCVLQTAKRCIKLIEVNTNINEALKAQQINLWRQCIKKYKNPINEYINTTKVPKYKEYTDEMEVTYFLDRILSEHMESFEWSKDSSNEESTIQENELLCKFVRYCQNLSLQDAMTFTNIDRKALKEIPTDDKTWVNQYIANVIDNTKKQIFRDEILKHPRIVIHSKAWNSCYESSFTSPLI